MKHLDRTLQALFWVPILLSGIIAIALVEPRLHRIGIISAAALGVFVVLIIVQAALERRTLSRFRSDEAEIAEKAAAASGSVSHNASAIKKNSKPPDLT